MDTDKALSGKRVLLGVTGGIAAYKTPELVRALRARGAQVQVVMTRGAAAFVTPLTLQAVSGRPVRSELLTAEGEAATGHIELARWADVILVAPATADFMARSVQGRADDLLTAVCLAAEVPVALAPAMNRAMWANAATRANRSRLLERGVAIWGPVEGEQACGELGEGRMLEPPGLCERLAGLFQTGALAGRRIVITAGPTYEPIDPVRFVGNRSSGRTGYALAEAAREAGGDVVLISGPVSLPRPDGVELVPVDTAAEMAQAVADHVALCDIFIAAAAVADYRPARPEAGKLKKGPDPLTLELEATVDIVARVAAGHTRPFVVGFAAETDNVRDNAEAKRRQKGLDMIVANRVGPGEGFDVADNAYQVLWEGGERSFPRTSKQRLTRQLIALIADRYEQTTKR